MNLLGTRRTLKFVIFCLFALNFLWVCQYLSFPVKAKPRRYENDTFKSLRYENITFKSLASMSKTSSISSSSTANKTSLKAIITKPVISTTKAPLKICSAPDSLVGVLKIDFIEIQNMYDSLMTKYNNMYQTVFEPATCIPKLSVAIIVPYRDRLEHLKYLLGHLHPFLSRQLNRYQIFVVEQIGNFTFNKGRLMNTGFNYVRKSYYGTKFDCFIFHDVDMLPENDFNLYECFRDRRAVQHLSCSLNKFNYRPLCCGMTVGGVLSFSEEQFIRVNGFSNDYWGWGGEDDDINTRLKKKQIAPWRPRKKNLCRYFMIPHNRDKLNAYHPHVVNARVKNAVKTSEESGLNNLSTKVINATSHFLYFHIFVDVGKP